MVFRLLPPRQHFRFSDRSKIAAAISATSRHAMTFRCWLAAAGIAAAMSFFDAATPYDFSLRCRQRCRQPPLIFAATTLPPPDISLRFDCHAILPPAAMPIIFRLTLFAATPLHCSLPPIFI